MKYYKDDIVEILTAKYKSYNEIPQHELPQDYESRKYGLGTVGQRFRVSSIYGDELYFGKDRWRPVFSVDSFTVRLYKRPFKNWIKYLIDYAKGNHKEAVAE